MISSRKITTEFIGVFLIGALVGGVVTWGFSDQELTRFMSRTNDPDVMVSRVSKKYVEEYHLSADEQKRIDPLVKEMSRRLFLIRHEFGVDFLNTLDEYHQKIGEQMAPGHRAAYEKANEERKKQLGAMLVDPKPSDQGQN